MYYLVKGIRGANSDRKFLVGFLTVSSEQDSTSELQ